MEQQSSHKCNRSNRAAAPLGMREVRPAVVTQPNEANGHPSIGDDPPQRDARRSMIIVAGLLSHIVPCAKSVRDFMWALTVALVSLAIVRGFLL
jgi:hypothetical protein